MEIYFSMSAPSCQFLLPSFMYKAASKDAVFLCFLPVSAQTSRLCGFFFTGSCRTRPQNRKAPVHTLRTGVRFLPFPHRSYIARFSPRQPEGGLPAPGENKNAVQDKPTQRSSRTPDAQAEMEQTRNLFLVKKGGIAYNIPCGAVSGRCVGAYSPAQAYGRWNARKLPHFCFPNKLYQAPAVNASRFSASGAQPAHAAACIRGVFSIPAGFFRAKRVY